MDETRKNTPATSHLEPPGTCELMFSPIPSCHSTDWPMTLLWNVPLVPASEPILQMDTHEAVEIGYCHSGAGVLVVEDKVLHFVPGDICVIGEQRIHMSRSELSTPSNWSYFWVDYPLLLASMPDGMELVTNDIFSHPDFPYVFSPAAHNDLCLMIRDVVDELERQPNGHRSVAKGIMSAFFVRLHRLFPDAPRAAAVSPREGLERVIPATHYMTSHYAEPMDMRQLARLCSLSPRHFRRVFVAAVGRTPLQYLSQFRIRMATALLIESRRPITQIAYEVGFESVNTFNRQFLAEMGVTPREWRRNRG